MYLKYSRHRFDIMSQQNFIHTVVSVILVHILLYFRCWSCIMFMYLFITCHYHVIIYFYSNTVTTSIHGRGSVSSKFVNTTFYYIVVRNSPVSPAITTFILTPNSTLWERLPIIAYLYHCHLINIQ